jgi:hypothetical protein
MKKIKTLEDFVGTRAIVTLNKSAKPFYKNLGIEELYPNDDLTLVGNITEVSRHGILLQHHSNGTHAWLQAVQQLEEEKISLDQFYEDQVESLFIPWHSIAGIN